MSDFEIYKGTKFHENPSSWAHVIPCGQWNDGPKYRQTDMTRLIFAFNILAKATIKEF